MAFALDNDDVLVAFACGGLALTPRRGLALTPRPPLVFATVRDDVVAVFVFGGLAVPPRPPGPWRLRPTIGSDPEKLPEKIKTSSKEAAAGCGEGAMIIARGGFLPPPEHTVSVFGFLVAIVQW